MTPSEPDLGELLRQAQQMQEQLASAQADAASKVVEGQSGGGAVKVEVAGDMRFRSVRVDPAAVDPDDVGMLEDLVLAAVNDAVSKVGELNASVLGSAGLGSLGDLGLPGILDG